MNIYGAIGIGCIVVSLLLAALNLFLLRKQRRKGEGLKAGKGNASSLLLSFYAHLSKVPLARELIFSIRKRLEVYSSSDERMIRKRSVILLFASILIYLAMVIIFWIFSRDLLMLFLFAVLLIYIGDTIVEIFVGNLQIRLLRQQIDYLDLLRHKYYESKSIEDANMEASNALNKKETFEAYTQAERINDILGSRDVEDELEDYYETAPNKYFKMMAGIMYITKEYGDTYIDGNSVFIRCIAYLTNEIKAELYKRDKLKYALKSLNAIAILPLFFLKPLRNWAAEGFAPMESFYSSKWGMVLGISIILISVLSYIVLRRLQRFDKVAAGIKRTPEQRIYSTALYGIVDRLVPQAHTRKGSILNRLIKNAMAPLNLYTLYTRRILYGCLAFLFGIVLFTGLNSYSRYVILYRQEMPDGYLGGKLSDEEYARLQNIADRDREVILKLGYRADEETISNELSKDNTMDRPETDAAVRRIRGKMKNLSSNIFWWWQLLLCFIFFGAGYNAPVIGLKITAAIRRIDMEEEVAQFHTIILMLMRMNRIHAYDILEWMETFSIYFKEPLQKCISNFASGHYEALEQLKSETAFSPFVKLIDSLQLACEDLGLTRAFEELENEMAFNRENRRETNERIVEKKKNLGNLIGFLPVYALITLYLIVPMIISGMQSISAFYQQLQQM